MQNRTYAARSRPLHQVIILAGLAGAMAEVVWIAAYCALTPLHGSEVLRGIAATVAPTIAQMAWAPILGLLIHFALGIAVAYAFAAVVWKGFSRRRGARATLVSAVIALGAIWAFNFSIVLPNWNPEFAGLLPYGVTFASKLLFGAALAVVFNRVDIAGATLGADRSKVFAGRPQTF